MDNDKFVEFLKLANKIYTFPNLNLSQQEIEILKEGLKTFLDKLDNYGEITKRVIKEMIDNSQNFEKLFYEIYAYMTTNDIRK